MLIKNDSRGSSIVEAALIFPVVIISLIAVVYIVVNLFMITCIRAGGDQSIEQTSYQLSGVVKTETENPKDKKLYYRFSDNGEFKKQIASSVKQSIKNISVYNSDEDISVDYTALAVYPRLELEIEKKYGLSKLWSESIDRKEKIQYCIHDECEFIRNIDLISDGIFKNFQSINTKTKEGMPTLPEGESLE